MTRQPCCGLTAPPTLRGSWSSDRGARVWRAVPVGSRPVPHRGCRTPMYRPELCARSGFQPEGLPPVPLPPKPREPGTSRSSRRGFPRNRHPVSIHGPQRWACGAPATGFRLSPATGGGGRHSPLPRFRDGQPEHFSPDHSGSPNHHPRGPPRVGRGSGSSGGLSAAALPVECGASPHFLRHPASPAAQRMWGHALDPPAPAPTGK
jgi:hypothetical protein